MKSKFIASIVALAIMLIAGITGISVYAAGDGVNVLGPGDVVGGVYITPGSRARDLVSGNHKAIAIDVNQSVLTSNGNVESAFKGSSTSAVNATPTAITIAAATGTTHCVTSIDFSNFHDATGTVTVAGGFILELVDGGATGGTVIWQRTFSWPAVANGVSQNFQWTFPTPIKGTAGQALALRCNSAALAHTGETISLQGYSIK